MRRPRKRTRPSEPPEADPKRRRNGNGAETVPHVFFPHRFDSLTDGSAPNLHVEGLYPGRAAGFKTDANGACF